MNNAVSEIVKGVGIADVGFCAFREISDRLLECRAKQRLPENAKTVICCIFPYKVKENPPKLLSRYAAVPDYHPICLEYLKKAVSGLQERFPDNRFECFVDNSPIPEVYAAAVSGLGVRGENGLLITKKYGSFVFLGEIVTDLEIKCENKFSSCIGCGKCKKNCPRINGMPCLSDLTQKKGEFTKAEAELLRKNNLLWGCDICAEVCPENNGAFCTQIPEFLENYRDFYEVGEDGTDRAYNWRGKKPIIRNFKNLQIID